MQDYRCDELNFLKLIIVSAVNSTVCDIHIFITRERSSVAYIQYNTIHFINSPNWVFQNQFTRLFRYDPSRVESWITRSSNLLKFHIHCHSYNLFIISSSSGVYNEPGKWQVTNWTNWLICSLLAQLIMALHRYRRGFYADFNGSNPYHPSIHRGTVINFGESFVTERSSAGPISNRISVHTRKATRYSVEMA